MQLKALSVSVAVVVAMLQLVGVRLTVIWVREQKILIKLLIVVLNLSRFSWRIRLRM